MNRTAIQWKFISLLSDRANGLIGHLSAIKMESYVRLRPRFKAARKIPPGLAVSGSLDDPYFLGLQFAVERVARSAWVSALPPEEKVNFVLDESALGGRVRALFDSIKGDENLGSWTSRLGGVQLRSSADYPPLQAADLWAYEALRLSEQYFAGQVTDRRWQCADLSSNVDWNSAAYFDDTGLLRVLEFLERPQ